MTKFEIKILVFFFYFLLLICFSMGIKMNIKNNEIKKLKAELYQNRLDNENYFTIKERFGYRKAYVIIRGSYDLINYVGCDTIEGHWVTGTILFHNVNENGLK